jgi:hypothetical protein
MRVHHRGRHDCYGGADFVVVAFRGTQPGKWKDIIADVTSCWCRGRPAWSILASRRHSTPSVPLLDTILARLAPGRTLWFCGHSLGQRSPRWPPITTPGRVACAGITQDRQFRICARVRREAGKSWYVNDHDVVTHVPPPIGYRHVDTGALRPEGSVMRRPAIPHFFSDLIGTGDTVETLEGLADAGRRQRFYSITCPRPTLWMRNDYDAKK